MKVGFLDIETTNLNADIGFILCASYKTADEKKVHHTRIDETPGYRSKMWDDTKCVRDIYKWINDEDIDILVVYNGLRFDIPYIETRLLNISIDGKMGRGLPKMRILDHFKTSKFKLKLHSWSLDALAKFLHLPVQKTSYDIEVWKKAMFGDKKELDNIVYHCDKDVLVLEAVHNRIKGQLKTLKPIN